MRTELLYALVNSGEVLSAAVSLRNARGFDLWVPTVTSGTMTLRGGIDQTSANCLPFEPIAPNTTGFAIGPGSKYLVPGIVGEALPPFIRAAFSNAMTAPTTLVFVAKL